LLVGGTNTQLVIRGTVFLDSNGNGVRDGDESPTAGVVVSLTVKGSRGAETRFAVTNDKGEYEFTGLVPGTYEVQVVVPPDVRPAAARGNGARTIELSDDQRAVTDVDFGVLRRPPAQRPDKKGPADRGAPKDTNPAPKLERDPEQAAPDGLGFRGVDGLPPADEGEGQGVVIAPAPEAHKEDQGLAPPASRPAWFHRLLAGAAVVPWLTSLWSAHPFGESARRRGRNLSHTKEKRK
jgi:hypothetical protein